MEFIDFSPNQCGIEELGEQLKALYFFSDSIRISLLKFSENITYLVEDKEKYVLRLNQPGYHDEEELKGELIWIEYLKRQTDLKIAGVVAGKDGNQIQRLSFQSSGLVCYCSLFEFLPGKTLSNMKGEPLLYYMNHIGEIAAKLHNHVSSWEQSRKLKRFTWNYEDLLGINSRWGHFSEMKNLTSYQKEIYENAISIIKNRMKKYGKNSDRYGLIHSDLNINNILVDGECISALDFDDCGYGWFLYDLSTSVLEYFEDSEAGSLSEVTKAWLGGYEKHRKLIKEDYEEIETFILLRKIVRVGWIATHITNDTVKKVDPAYYEKVAKMAENFCSKNRNGVDYVRGG